MTVIPFPPVTYLRKKIRRSVEVDPLGSRERGRAQGKLAQGQGECYSGDKATQPLDNKASPAPGAR